MIKLIKGYKYDNNYDYVKIFSSKEEQDTFFNSLPSVEIDEHNYIKEHETFKIQIPYDELMAEGINYIIFNNGFRNVFAFITLKEYINNKVTRINYEIDVIQTFMFNFSIKKSFIERKVCNINEISDFDEGLEIGEHEIISNEIAFEKESTWFAMFNGIKEQQLVFNDNGILTDSINLPYYTSKPLTIIDGIQYPLFFLPLQETNSDLTPNGTSQPTNDIIVSARKLLGLPYVWGGNYPPLGSDNGTDCSGLCQWAYNDANLTNTLTITGRWTTYTMYEHSTVINIIDSAKVGDILFSNFSSPGVPEHVAIISKISGSQFDIIEAPQEGIPIREITIDFDNSTMQVRRLNIK